MPKLPTVPAALSRTYHLMGETWEISLRLFKIMIPVIIVVKLLKELGLIEHLGALLSPVMQLVGLPGSMGLVWAATLLTGIYGGIVAFVSLAADNPLSVAQVTVLASMMLVAHALPVELGIAQKAGARLPAMGVIRVGGAFVFGWCLHLFYSLGGWLQQSSSLSWAPPMEDPSVVVWALTQLKGLSVIYCLVFILLVVLRALDKFGVTSLINKSLHPVLILLGIGKSASPITIIGMTLGLAYGGGLILQEAHSGRMKPKDIFFSLLLMGMCHSIIEDTLLVMLIGGHLSGILWGRLIFSLIVVFGAVRLISNLPQIVFDRLLFSIPNQKTVPLATARSYPTEEKTQ